MANLLDLCDMPEVQDKILRHLGVRDVKALRQSCRKTRKWIDNSNVKDHWGRVSATIDLKYKPGKLTFDLLNSLPFAVYELTVLNYSSPSLLVAKRTGNFVKAKGAGVKKLRLDLFYGCRYDDEFTFLEGLSGLQELTVDHVNLHLKLEGLPAGSLRFPASIRYLLKFEYVNDCPCVLRSCPQIREFLSATRFTTVLKPPLEWNRNVGEYLEETLLMARHRRCLENEAKTNYTHIDLSGHPRLGSAIKMSDFTVEMRQFLGECRSNSMNVLNVSPLMLVDYDRFLRRTSFIEGSVETVESISGWHWSLKRLRSSTLKELRIPSTGRSVEKSRVPEAGEVKEKYSWPNLQLLHVSFNMDFQSVEDVSCCMEIIRALHLGPVCLPYSCLNASGFKVAELELNFPRWDETDESMAPNGVICPSSIVEHYPNVKILKMTGWDAEDSCWIQLWKGLLQLEEVQIADCRKLGDKGFISDRSTEQSPFLKLRNLKKLTLKLNNMPKIGSSLFREVITNLPLEEFYLHTGKTVGSKKLSRQTVEFMANGTFGLSVKKFPFDNIGLNDPTTDEELQQLKFLFSRAHF